MRAENGGDGFPDTPLSENKTLSDLKVFHAWDKYHWGIPILGKMIESFKLDYKSWLVCTKILTCHNGFVAK